MQTTRRPAQSRLPSPSPSAEAPAERRAAAQAPAAMATDHRRKRAVTVDIVERYRRPARWFHAGTYVGVLILTFTGWWLRAGPRRFSPAGSAGTRAGSTLVSGFLTSR